MKKLFYLIAAGAIMLCVTSDLFAQGQGQRGQGQQGQIQGQRQGMQSFSERQSRNLLMLTDSLQLSKVQVEAIKKVNTAYDAKITALREQMGNQEDRTAMREQMRDIMGKYNTEVKAVLTEEQKPKYDSILENRRSQRSQSREGTRGRN